MIRTGVHDALHALLLRRQIQVVETADIRFEQILERRFDRNTAQLNHRVDAFEQRMDRLRVREAHHQRFLMRRHLAKRRDIADAHDIGRGGARTAYLPAEVAGDAGQ